jgi:hypothetical protein
MVILLKEKINSEACWVCGQRFEETSPVITLPSAKGPICVCQNCAESTGQRLLQDVTDLVDLGYLGE